MTEEEIRKMVSLYDIKDNHDGRIMVRLTKNMTEDEKNQIKANKAEILAYLQKIEAEKAAKEEAEKAEYLRKKAVFEAIPGVKEIRKAREDWEDYRYEFQKAFERGNGRYPAPPAVDSKEIKKLEETHPAAVFALEMESQKHNANYELAAIAEKAYDALCNEENWEEVKKQYEKDKHEFVLRHVWD